MKFLVDAMFPPSTAEILRTLGHDAVGPADLGASNLPDDVLVELAAASDRVIVTENASDFAGVTECPVLFVLKSWWSPGTLATRLATALDRWAKANPAPGPWPHWLPAALR